MMSAYFCTNINIMKHVTIVVPECIVNLNSIGGAYEILSRANGYWQKIGNSPKLQIQVAGYAQEQGLKEQFFKVYPDDLNQIKKTDLVIIPSIFDDFTKTVKRNEKLINWITRQYKEGAEIASMCSGAFLLAATGILDGRTCSIHWNSTEEFKKMYPDVKVAQDQIITDEKGVYTNGGGYSFLNLMLYLVEKYFDREVAIFCSKIFQIDIERTSQSQFSIFHIQKTHGDEIVEQAQSYIEEHMTEKISFEKLADSLAVSRRNFDRRFIKATGNTPVEYLQRVKVEAAKKQLENGRKPINEIMYEVGYADMKAFREVFKKNTGMSPLDYKTKYNSQAAVAY
jgi:transcriptional regulator GlxA family with amidase domain